MSSTYDPDDYGTYGPENALDDEDTKTKVRSKNQKGGEEYWMAEIEDGPYRITSVSI